MRDSPRLEPDTTLFYQPQTRPKSAWPEPVAAIRSRVSLALELESTIAARAKENQVESGKEYGKGLQNSAEPIEPVNTREQIASIAGVSHDTVAKVKTIKAKASDETKDKLAKGEISINKAYQARVDCIRNHHRMRKSSLLILGIFWAAIFYLTSFFC